MSDARTLTVLHEDGGAVVGDLIGAVNPVVALNDQTMSELLLVLRDAQAQVLVLQPKGDVTAILALCAKLGRIVEIYSATRNKYFGGVSDSVERAAVMREFDRLSKELERFHK
jgi:hypothetical protein